MTVAILFFGSWYCVAMPVKPEKFCFWVEPISSRLGLPPEFQADLITVLSSASGEVRRVPAVGAAGSRHDRRRRGVVAFELGVRGVGIAERVELPFLVGRLRAAGADGRLERRLVLVEDRDDVVQRLAVAHGVVADQGIGRCRQSSLLW